MSLEDFVEVESKKLDEDKKKWAENKEFAPFFNLPEGESKVEFLGVEPRKITTDNGVKVVFAIEVVGQKFDFAVNPRNPIYREIVHKLKEGKRVLHILRIGTKKDTRYKILEK